MKLSRAKHLRVVKGWFHETLSRTEIPMGIALLRMDADWYESTMEILKAFFPRLNSGGILIIDDYYTWDGCSRAIHDYLSEHSRTERIESLNGVCFLVKRS